MRPVGAAPIHADRGRTDMKKIIDTFRDLMRKHLKNEHSREHLVPLHIFLQRSSVMTMYSTLTAATIPLITGQTHREQHMLVCDKSPLFLPGPLCTQDTWSIQLKQYSIVYKFK